MVVSTIAFHELGHWIILKWLGWEFTFYHDLKHTIVGFHVGPEYDEVEDKWLLIRLGGLLGLLPLYYYAWSGFDLAPISLWLYLELGYCFLECFGYPIMMRKTTWIEFKKNVRAFMLFAGLLGALFGICYTYIFDWAPYGATLGVMTSYWFWETAATATFIIGVSSMFCVAMAGSGLKAYLVKAGKLDAQ